MKPHSIIFFIFLYLIFLPVLGRGQLKDVTPAGHPNEQPAPEKNKVPQEKTPAPQKAVSKPAPTAVIVPHTPVFKEPEMVLVDGGVFMMGNNNGFTFERPAHTVKLTSFLIGKFEVTQAQWFAVMGNHPSLHENCDDCPVENVSWNEAQEFVEKLNKKTKKKYRLPTEAEWEFAARGGNISKNFSYSGSNNSTDVSWSEENSNGTSQRVGQKVPNELGLYDMSGNVSEWCADYYDKQYYNNSATDNPQGPTSGSARVRRGGSWADKAKDNNRSTCRNFSTPEVHQNYNGFRLCRSQ